MGDQRGEHRLLRGGAGRALRWAPIRHAVLRESQSRSPAKGARPGAHGGSSPRVEQADKARRAPIVTSLWSPDDAITQARGETVRERRSGREVHDATRPLLAVASFYCRGG